MNIAGVLLFIIGLFIRLYATITLEKNYSWTLEIREAHKLVKRGLYKYIRHPIYLGAILGAIAVPAYVPSILGFFIVILSIPLFIYRMGIEERMLIEEFGDEYREYMEST